MTKKYVKFFIPLCVGILFCGILATTGCKSDDDDDKIEDLAFSYGDHSYLIVKQLKTWAEAAVDAAKQGGYLAEIESKEEQNSIWQAILKANIAPDYVKVPDGGGIGYLWIGATDRYGEDIWMWNGANASGTFPLFWLGNNKGSAVAGSYVNWGGSSKGKTNEPDNYTDSNYSPKGQSAAAIGLASWPSGSSSPLGIAGEWNDIAETNKIYYVIEFDTNK
jgi:hypothetical protein